MYILRRSPLQLLIIGVRQPYPLPPLHTARTRNSTCPESLRKLERKPIPSLSCPLIYPSSGSQQYWVGVLTTSKEDISISKVRPNGCEPSLGQPRALSYHNTAASSHWSSSLVARPSRYKKAKYETKRPRDLSPNPTKPITKSLRCLLRRFPCAAK